VLRLEEERAPSGPEDASHLAERRGAVGQQIKDAVQGDRVGSSVPQRQGDSVGLHEREARIAAAGERQHGAGGIDSDHRPLHGVAQVLGGITGAATQVDDEAGSGWQVHGHEGAMALPHGMAGDQLVG